MFPFMIIYDKRRPKWCIKSLHYMNQLIESLIKKLF